MPTRHIQQTEIILTMTNYECLRLYQSLTAICNHKTPYNGPYFRASVWLLRVHELITKFFNATLFQLYNKT